MAITRTSDFYDLIAQGLNGLGYTSFNDWVDDTFREKYNAEATFAQMGFPLNPTLPIRPTYEQLEATVRPYTMAGYVDVDSDGPTKSTDGFSLKMGQIPIFKHEITIDRKVMRDQLTLASYLGNVTPEIREVAMSQLFYSTDNLIGGNYNTFRYQRHQIVSKGKLVINATNNPMGIPIEIDFGVPSKNITTHKCYTKGANGTITEKADSNLVQTLKDTKYNAEQKDRCPQGHWEVAKNTWQNILKLDSLRKLAVTMSNPLVDDDTRTTLATYVEEDAFKAWFEKVIGAPVVVVDFIGYVEKFSTSNKKMEYVDCPAFEEDVMVYVPDGSIGDAQFGKPFVMQTPGARVALFDGGRTLIRQVFNDENMVQTIKSEVSGLCVPNKTRWFYYVKIA